MPGSASTYGRRGTCTVTRWRGEHLGRAVVRAPAAVADPRRGERLAGVLRVAHAVHQRAQAEPANRVDQELAQLAVALTVAPVADPHEVADRLDVVERVGTCARRRPRATSTPRSARPRVEVQVADHAAEREDAVVARQVERAHRLGIGDHPVVRVVEQQPVPAGRTVPPARGHHRGLAPLVHDHDVGPVDHRGDVELVEVVHVAAQLREGAANLGDRLRARDRRRGCCGSTRRAARRRARRGRARRARSARRAGSARCRGSSPTRASGRRR